MTPADLLAIVNNAVRIAAEVKALPEQTELSLLRALTAARVANEAVAEFNAQIETERVLQRMRSFSA